MTRRARHHLNKQMTRAACYLKSWFFFWRVVQMARTKKHGKGATPWHFAFGLGHCYRVITYGQFYKNSRCWKRERRRLGLR